MRLICTIILSLVMWIIWTDARLRMDCAMGRLASCAEIDRELGKR